MINRDFQINLFNFFLKVLSGYRLRHLAEKPPLLRAKGKTKKYVNLVGLEPTPHSLKGYYSNQLSYRFPQLYYFITIDNYFSKNHSTFLF